MVTEISFEIDMVFSVIYRPFFSILVKSFLFNFTTLSNSCIFKTKIHPPEMSILTLSKLQINFLLELECFVIKTGFKLKRVYQNRFNFYLSFCLFGTSLSNTDMNLNEFCISRRLLSHPCHITKNCAFGG